VRLPCHRSLLAIALLATCGACTRQPAAPAAETTWAGNYRGSLQVPGGEIPFGLVIEQQAEAARAWLVNGPERVPVTEVAVNGDEITMLMPGFEHRLTATRHDGQLTGELFMVKAKGQRQHIPFTAVRGAAPRFFPAPGTPGGDVSGRWSATFTGDGGASYIAVGEFAQQGDVVSGTFLTPTGDYRFLNGELRDGQLYLATFNGGHVFLFHARLGADGATLDGEFWSGLASHERFTSRRDTTASLGATTAVTEVRRPAERFAFTFPDLEGKPVSLADTRFNGKVVVVTLGGSWCPNCHDETVFMQQYLADHRATGLEVVGLMFEQLETAAEAREAITRFRDRYGVSYPLLLAGISDRTDAATRLPQLNGVFAYPTTILVDRKGRVRHIHTGFSGPATGQHYTELTGDLDQRIQALLAEKI
jgi:peroxiredoxin